MKSLKVNILYGLDRKLNDNIFNRLNKNKKNMNLNKEKINKIKKNIFSYIFPDKSNKYFYCQYSEQINLKTTEANFEKIMYT